MASLAVKLSLVMREVKQSIHPRELSYYLLLAAILLFACFLVALAVWYLKPREPRITLSLSAYPPSDVPYKITEDDTTFWLVHHDDQLLALLPITPDPEPFAKYQCYYAWNDANGRFEDPCSGSKFALDGTYIEGLALRNLDRYPVTIRGQEIIVRTSEPILGEAVPLPLRTVDPSFFNYLRSHTAATQRETTSTRQPTI